LAVSAELSGSRRRVCSDTETMNYDDASSSDDVEDDRTPGEGEDDPAPPPKALTREDSCSTMIVNETDGDSVDNGLLDSGCSRHRGGTSEEETVPALPPRTPKQQDSSRQHSAGVEGQYLPMVPTSEREGGAGAGQYLHMAPNQHSVFAESRESVASASSIPSRGSSSANVATGNMAPPTPSEMLVAALAADHARTPSQTLVMEHMTQEQVGRAPEDMYVFMNEDGTERQPAQPILAPPQFGSPARLPAESPRYCEIDEPATPKERAAPPPSHYEYLFKARSATPLHYEVVYQEIQDEDENVVVVTGPPRGREGRHPPPRSAAAMAGLPDIVGDSPVLLAKGNYSSSDADDEVTTSSAPQQPSLSSSFIPASFYLEQSPSRKTMSHERLSGSCHPRSAPSAAGSVGSLNVVEDDLARRRHLRDRARPASTTPMRGARWVDDPRHLTSPPSSVSGGDVGLRGSVSSADSRRSSRAHLEEIREETGRRPAPPPPKAAGLVDLNEEGEQLEQMAVPSLPHSRQASSVAAVAPSAAPYYVSDVVSAGEDTLIEYEGAGEGPADPIARRPFPVPRAESLEGLLGDNPGGPRDSVEVTLGAGESPYPLATRATTSPKPTPWEYPDADDQEDEETWRQSLRRASARQRARSDPPPEPERRRSNPMRQTTTTTMTATNDTEISPRLTDYVWDERGQRFYRLRSSSSSQSAAGTVGQQAFSGGDSGAGRP